jgi:hypothetical protein
MSGNVDQTHRTEPTVNKGLRFSLAEWAIVYSLMRTTGLRFTHLAKAAFALYADQHGLRWPKDPDSDAA